MLKSCFKGGFKGGFKSDFSIFPWQLESVSVCRFAARMTPSSQFFFMPKILK
jgi:hypothetical protein